MDVVKEPTVFMDWLGITYTAVDNTKISTETTEKPYEDLPLFID